MSFAPLTIDAESFNQVGPGKYMLGTVTFGQPKDYLLIKGGTFNRTSGLTTASVSTNVEKDITVGSVTKRHMASVQVVLQIPNGFTTVEVDEMLERLSTFVTSANLERLLQGEQ